VPAESTKSKGSLPYVLLHLVCLKGLVQNRSGLWHAYTRRNPGAR
jgi:hypothetical protein